MGCDETAGWLVLNALTRLSGMEWVGSATASPASDDRTGPAGRLESGKSGRAAAQTKPSRKASPGRGTARQTEQAAKAPPSVLPEVTSKTHDAIDERVAAWLASGNKTAAGNLGEQVALRALERLGYQVLVTQWDLQGAVPSILGYPTRMNPEDFIVITPNGEYSSMNSKASTTERTSKILASGDLKAPRMGKDQDNEQYYSTRAGLQSPLEGKSFGRAIKVDLVHKQAQVFDIGDDRRLTPVGDPIDVLSDIAAVCLRFPKEMPPPIGPNSAEKYAKKYTGSS